MWFILRLLQWVFFVAFVILLAVLISWLLSAMFDPLFDYRKKVNTWPEDQAEHEMEYQP